MSTVVNLNQLEKRSNGVFGLPGVNVKDFGYSDGEQVEQYLHKIFSNTRDLSSRSRELQTSIIDWPSEYHLSSDRANLLRGYDLSFVKNALEFGSGCGAISRYLGEQGIAVEAIEGSATRAALGKMRCRDLESVTVINANYNELAFPEKHYDLILLVGVIEYASKFFPQAKSDREAALAILNKSKRMLSKEGVVIIAIENRLGLKYILGQHEDHYAKRYIGIHGYGNSAGIATYSDIEWRNLVEEVGFNTCVFSYPFPDYKIPRVTLGEDYVKNDPNAFNHLEGIFARDYHRPVAPSPTESIAWQAASGGKFLHKIANSFCLVIGNNVDSVNQAMCFDFCHMPGSGRKNEYAVITRKLRHQNIVQKIPLLKTEKKPNKAVQQTVADQPYIKGNLLSTEWLRSILIYSRRDEFEVHLTKYFSYLCDLEENDQQLKIDMLPINIIVGEEGNYHCFDQEWEVEWQITKEYLLFRALLTFIVTNWGHLKEFLSWLELHTVKEFIDYGFCYHRILLAEHLDKFIAMENQFQEDTTYYANEKSVEHLLKTSFDFSRGDRDVYATLFWADKEDDYCHENSVEVSLTPNPDRQTLEFIIPDTAGSICSIRLDPFDTRKKQTVGFFSVINIKLIEKSEIEENILWQLCGEREIAKNCKATSALFEPTADTGSWLSTTDFPKLDFRLDTIIMPSKGASLRVVVELKITESIEYILAHQRFLRHMRDEPRQQLELDFKHILQHLESAREKIRHIEAGKPFKIGMKIISLLSIFKR